MLVPDFMHEFELGIVTVCQWNFELQVELEGLQVELEGLQVFTHPRPGRDLVRHGILVSHGDARWLELSV
jgi:hypothetical protein